MDQSVSRWPCYCNRYSCVSVLVSFISELDTILLDSDAIVVPDDCAPWMKGLEFCGSLVSVKTHTGADITVISKPVHHSLKSRPPLMVNKTVLNSPAGRFPVAGSFIWVILKDGKQYKFNMLVVDSALKNNLQSRSLSRMLGLVSRQMKLVRFQKLVNCAWIQCTFT